MSDQRSDSEQQGEQLGFILIIAFSNSISIISSATMIFFYIKFKNIRNFAFQLVFFLNISDLIWSIANIIDIFHRDIMQNDFGCTLQAFLINFSGLSSVIWTAIIAWVLYKSVMFGARRDNLSFLSYIFFGYIIPLLMSVYPLLGSKYGSNDESCWIKQNYSWEE